MTQTHWRVVIADDHAVTRQGIRVMLDLRDDVEVVGEAGTGAEAVRIATERNANLVLMDLNMPEMGGVAATRRLKEVAPDVAVIVLTVHEDDGAIKDAIQAGASGYLAKSSGASDIRSAIDALRTHGVYMSPSVTRSVLRSASLGFRNGHRPSPAAGTKERITAREREILRLLGDGLTARSIGTRLGISERTVNTHVGNLYRRMGVTNRVEAIRAAMRAGLVDLPR